MPTNHIVIGDISPRIRYTADGTQTAFTFPFPIFDIADILVFQDDTAIPSGFTVTGAGQSAGGTVTFDTAPTSGVAITLLRRLTVERTTDFEEGGAFRASVINDELDRQTAFIQDLSDGLDRAVKVPDTSTLPEILLPDPAAGRALMWNGTGDGLENSVDDVNGIVTNATTQATSAATSAAAAAASAGGAATSETAAGTSASAAATSATAAAGSAQSAAGSAAILPDPATGTQGQVPQINATLDGYALGSVSATDANVKVSANDTTAGDLEAKLLAGDGVVATTQNEGANETRTLALKLAAGDTGLEFAGGGLRVAPTGPAATSAAADDTILIADASNAGALRGTTIQGILDLVGSDNITLNAFRIAINGGLSVQSMVDGFVDEFEDETGVDLPTSTNEGYLASGRYYTNVPIPVTAYTNAGGQGDRTASITVSTTATTGGGALSNLVDGATANNTTDSVSMPAGNPSLGEYFRFDFGVGIRKYIDEITLAQDVAPNDTFKIQGSNDATAWTDLDSFTWNTGTSQVVALTDVTPVGYRYYQVIGTGSGNWANTWFNEVTFRIAAGGTPADMSLVSASVEAEAGPGDARVVLLVEPIDTVTINTDVKAWATRNDGATWDPVTLSDEGIFSGSRRVWAGPATLTPITDETMRWKVTTHNTKEVRLHGAALEWS